MTELTSKQLAKIANEARALVNSARTALGQRTLFDWFKGLPRHADCCPVSLALDRSMPGEPLPLVDGVTIRFEKVTAARVVASAWGRAPEPDTNQVVLPFAIARFIRLFDAGCYPQLERPFEMKEAA